MLGHQSTYSKSELDQLTRQVSSPSKLPTDQMALFDRITHVSDTGGKYDKGEVVAVFAITPDKWFFDCHFKGDPVMPGCLGLDVLWQLGGFFLSWTGVEGRGRALGAGEVKFFGEILPRTREVVYRIDVRRILRRTMTMLVADGEVFADGEQIYTASNLRVAMLPAASAGMQP